MSYRIIVVDDEEITRKALSNYIGTYRMDFKLVGTFSDGSKAIEYLSGNPVDVVLTDIRMPIVDGLELAKFIYHHYPNCITFIISGYGEFEYAKTAMSYGVANYILKPIDFDELKEGLDKISNTLQESYRKLDFTQEDTELFFIDLITGSLKDPSVLREQFNKKDFPFTLEHSPGTLLRLNLELNDILACWQYGSEKLSYALLNVIRMSLPDIYVYPIYKTGMIYDYIIVAKDSVPNLDCNSLETQMKEVLGFSATFNTTTPFHNLIDLAGSQINHEGDLITKRNHDINNDDIVIQKAIEYINTHYDSDLTREDVADAVYLSSAYFSRFFKQKTGQSFFDYLTTVRMQKAIELLGTKTRINDIAKKVGYQSRNRFYINFRQYTSYNPTEYRKLILKVGDVQDEADESF